MTPMRRRLRKLRFFVQAAFVTLVISAAVIVAFAQMVLPWLAENPRRIEGWLSERLSQPVSIGQVSSVWTRSGPRLVFDDLRIGDPAASAGEVRVPRSELAFNLYAAFQRNRSWNEFRVVGLDLALNRESDGDWKLLGFDLDVHGDNASMGALGVVVLVDMRLSVKDPQHHVDLALRIPELRVVNLGKGTRVLGRLGNGYGGDAPLSLVADIDTAHKSGRLYIGGQGLDIAALSAGHAVDGIKLISAEGDLQGWASWRDGRIDDVRIKLGLNQMILETDREIALDDTLSVQPRSAFEALSMSARWQRKDAGWRLDVADLSATRQGESVADGRLIANISGDPSGSWDLAASSLDIGTLAPIAMLIGSTPARLRQWLYRGNPRGTVEAVEIHGRTAETFDVDVALSEFISRADDSIPGIDSLTTRLRGDAQGLLLEIPDQQVRIDYPRVFRKPFEFSHLGGDIAAWKEADEWYIESPDFQLESEGFAAGIRGGVQLHKGSKPSIDLAAVVTRGNVEAAKLFWPTTSMPPNAIDWLDRALEAGEITAGRAIIHGDLDSWPFDDRRGRFEARAELSHLKLAFLDDWPSGVDLAVSASFINNGMQAIAHSGKTHGLIVDNAEATIADFHEPVLQLVAEGHGKGKDLLGYLRATPVGEDHADKLAGLSIGGNGVAHVEMTVPLKHHEDSTLGGRVDLSDADLDESTWDLHFSKANGRVTFGRDSVAAEALETRFQGFPVSLGIAIGSAARDSENSFEATLDGVLPVKVAFAKASGLESAFTNFPGQADWHVALAIGSENGSAKGRNVLTLASNLEGIAINLPEPLAKPAQSVLPFSLNLEMPPVGNPFSARLGDIVAIEGRLPSETSPLSAKIDLGPEKSASDIPDSGIRMGGHAEIFDVGGWIGMFSAGGGSGDLVKGIDIKVDDLRLAGRSFPNLQLAFVPNGDAKKITVAGVSLEGEISVPSVDMHRRGITAQMKHVRWPDLPPGSEDAPAPLASVDPASIPPLHVWIGKLALGAIELGEMRLESFPTPQGMRLDRFETRSPNLDMRASGDWTGDANRNQSHLAIDITAENLGKMLDAFGFSGIIEGGQTVANIYAEFPGSPAAFALASATGSLHVNVEDGRILDVEPGAGGRLFGLFSLREIPRRLSLDFSDLFKSGMSFSSIKGGFILDGGSARTDDLLIASPAADIKITGRTDLRKRQYDQEMSVTPRAGVALPVVGALAGGPVGAAAGLVVQTLIGKKLNKAARSRYKVSGSWEKPVIALIGREKISRAGDESASDDANGRSDDADGVASESTAEADAIVDPIQAVIEALPVLGRNTGKRPRVEVGKQVDSQQAPILPSDDRSR